MKIHRDLTLVLPYYMNPGMLQEQQTCWASYPDEYRSHLHVIVVDDGSPERPAADVFEMVPGLASQSLYRVGVDVRWNWLTCRNIGMHHAPTEWALLTDIDHLVPLETLQTLLRMKLHANQVYRLSRVDAPHPLPYALTDCSVRMKKDRVHIHPNTWLMTREMYDTVGGYDERFSGCYGTDYDFRDRVKAHARAITILEEPLVRYGREILPDASTTVFTRKNDPVNDADLVNRRLARAAEGPWVPLRLTFPYELQVAHVNQAVSA